jgi:phosphate transport system protein
MRALKELLVEMAGLVESALEAATQALQARSAARFEEVFTAERRINQLHKDVDEACVKLLATQQPLANDLRVVVAILKINTDLERMGDQAVNIAHNSEIYLREKPLKPLVDLPKMGQEVRLMVREALDAFVKGDVALARVVLKRDDQVDSLKGRIFDDVIERMRASPEAIDAGIALILIARNLERIGDHATNVAEDVIFAVTGEDIRHSPHAGHKPIPKEAEK